MSGHSSAKNGKVAETAFANSRLECTSQMLVKGGAVKAVTSALGQHCSNLRVQECACWALENLALDEVGAAKLLFFLFMPWALPLYYNYFLCIFIFCLFPFFNFICHCN